MTEPLRIVVVGTAIPVEAGAPEQRAAVAFRRALERFGLVHSAVVDLTGAQLTSRSLLQKSMSLTPLRSPATSPDAVHDAMAGSGELENIVDRRRLDRFLRRVAASRPDLIVVDDAALAGLGDRLRTLGAKLVLCDGDGGAIHQALAADAPSSHDARWHALRAELTRRGAARAGLAFDQVWKVGSAFRLADAAGADTFRVPLPSMGVADRRLSEKTGPVLIVSSGFGWLDKATLPGLAKHIEGFARQTDEPGVALVGFDQGAVGPLARFATIDPDWRNLNFRLGQARFLLAPVAGPGTAEVIKSALASGTPVLCPIAIAQLLGFDAAAGVFPYRADALAGMLERGAFGSERDAEANAAIAAAAQAAFGAEETVAAASHALAALFGRELTPSAPSGLRRDLRFSPLVAPAKLMFNMATRMLLLRVKVLKKLGVNEIRILDAKGAEMTRILANVDATNRPVQEIEGGAVLPAGLELGDVTVALYDGDVELHVIETPLADIEMLDGEVFSLNLDGAVCEGAIWATAPEGEAVWQIEHAGQRTRVTSRQGVKLKNLDVVALPFKMLRSRESAPGAPVTISRVDQARKAAISVLQRPATVSHLTCAQGGQDQPHAAQALKELHRGKRAWMIGNGPSVRLEDLDAVPDGDVKFAFNRFYKCYGDTRLREDYVVSADMLMIDDFGQEMVDLSTGLPLFCRNRVISEVSGRFVELTPGDTYLPLFSYDPAKFVSIGGSSVFVALQMAYYMGIREIFLYGMDFSFSMSLGRDPRYKFPVSFDDNNHFIKGYRDAKPWCPPTWRDISAGFLNARAAFELGGGRVLNATRGGKLEIFDRIDFETAAGRSQAIKKSA